MKRIFIVHGWEFNPRMHWYPWLKKELEKKGFAVTVLKMPETEKPVISKWTSALKKAAGIVDKNTYFIGHSIGCQTIIRYLSKQKNKSGGAVFVGGWFALSSAALPDRSYEKIAKPWLLDPIDFVKAKKNLGTTIAFLSDNDAYVPLARNAEVFRKVLGAKVIVEKNKGHYTSDDGVMEVPNVLKEFFTLL